MSRHTTAALAASTPLPRRHFDIKIRFDQRLLELTERLRGRTFFEDIVGVVSGANTGSKL